MAHLLLYMAIVAIKGSGIVQYFKAGYNIVRRYQRGEEPDDALDCFEYCGSSKVRKDAEKKAKKLAGIIEIIEHKQPSEDL